MPKSCVAANCSNFSSESVRLYSFPREEKLRKQWISQVRRTRADWPGPTTHSRLCSEHFGPECFDQALAVRESLGFGYNCSRNILPTAVPTIFKRGCTESPPVRKSKAVEKREHQKAVETLLLDSPLQEKENDCGLALVKDASTSASIPRACRTVGTLFKPKSREAAVQTHVSTTVTTSSQTHETSFPWWDEMENECNEHGERMHQDTDPDYIPSDIEDDVDINDERPLIENDETDSLDIIEERKYIVFWSSLQTLFALCVCRFCGATGLAASNREVGTLVAVTLRCTSCTNSVVWNSQPYVGKIPAGNLLLSAGILYSGALISKTMRVLKHMGVACYSLRTFFRHQKHILIQSVRQVWQERQQWLFAALQAENRGLVLGGDGRADSPGHSAKYGTYTLMEMEAMAVIDVELVQSNQCGGSYHMEKAGLVLGLQKLEENYLDVETLITDRHPQIAKFIQEEHPGITHEFDIWHVAKGIKKKLKAVARGKDLADIQAWIPSIVNHLYWSVVSSPLGNGQLVLDKWLSILDHIQNIHSGFGGLFQSCVHGPLTGRERRKRWIKPDTRCATELEKIITNKRLCKDIKRLSGNDQTSYIEAFHSLLIQFAPKTYAFSYPGLLCRSIIATMHFNENAGRQQRITAQGEDMYSLHYPKHKGGGHTVRKVLNDPTYGYVEDLLAMTVTICKASDINDEEMEALEIPPNLNSIFEIPEKHQAVDQFRSRFSKC